MNGQSSTRRRRRHRSAAEQMWWDQASPSERLAFTLGYVAGQGIDFPNPRQIDVLAVELGAKPLQRPPASVQRTVSPRTAGETGGFKRTSDGRRFTYDLAEVARIATHAVTNGVATSRAVFEQIPECASPKAAEIAIHKARKAGYYIPPSPRGRKPKQQRGAA